MNIEPSVETSWECEHNPDIVRDILRCVSLISGNSEESVIDLEKNPYKYLKDDSLSNYAKYLIKILDNS